MFSLLALLYVILAFGILRANCIHYSELIPLVLCFALMIANHYMQEKMGRMLYLASPFIMTGLVIYANLHAVTSDYKVIIINIVALIILEYPPSFSLRFLLVPLIAYLGLSSVINPEDRNVFSLDYFMGYIVKNSVIYIMITLSIFLTKRQLLLNNHLETLMKENRENREKILELEIAEERTRIAREIHDTLGSTLTGAIIQLEAAKKYVPLDHDKAIASIEKTQDITRIGFSEVKRAIKALRPIDVSKNTLKESIMLLKNRIESSYHFTLETCINIPCEIDEKIKITVYSIIQELVTNSIKHSGTKNLFLTIDVKSTTLFIYTHDNGKGSLKISEGYGLTGIRERAEQLGGNVRYSSHEIEGFQAMVTIPLI